MDRLRCIEVFNEVARSRSFSAAALRLGIAKGNVTKHVAWLEELLGAQLLSRTTKSVSLTEAGLSLLESGQDLLDRFEEVEDAVRGAVQSPKGTIRIGTPPSFGAAHLVPLITTFSSLHRDIQFALHLDDGKLDLVSEGLDLSVRIAPSLKDTSLVAQKLGSAPQMLVASQAYLAANGEPQTPLDLSRHDCLVNALKAPTNFWTFTGPEGERSVRVSGTMRSDFGEPLRHAAMLGHGISMHPTYMVAQDIRENRLKIVLPVYTPTGLDIYAVYPSRRNMPGRVRLFLEFLREHFDAASARQAETPMQR
ncbi:LysR family transcriptional regulator [Glaciimonas immobilis]|uniref:DNA-binding transcriptional LysR family regulator n=1 Tax=Glaciimonas immobilis TaxID=728004 RepID=A0A840RTQ7_9BURK|nr:LysR family transcriptional regulator [Glaciimonas immobilis]KAF3997012.1 LysR family transcriptional regulator [Glaciimonas immobilis]MBB5199849.1 DNA-binding transcriptional LysR family regulator [Glaciimonas immobilis]